MGTINTRLDRLEQRRGSDDQRKARVSADAAFVLAKVEALAVASNTARSAATPADRVRWDAWSASFLTTNGQAA
jgi:hypothetical protein